MTLVHRRRPNEGRLARRLAGRWLLLGTFGLLLLASVAEGDARWAGAAALVGLAWAGSEYRALTR